MAGAWGGAKSSYPKEPFAPLEFKSN